MKKLSVLSLLLVLLVGCMLIPDNGNSIKGKWALSAINISLLQDYDTGYEHATMGMFPEFDDYYSAPIMEISNELMAVYMNLPGSSVFGMVGLGNDVIVSEDSLRIVMPKNDILSDFLSGLTVDDTLGLAYTIDEEGKLSILYEIMDDHLNIPSVSLELEFLSYRGELPRSEWLSTIEDDMYESDSVMVDTNELVLNVIQERTLSPDDLDIAKISVVKDSLYSAQVFSNMRMEIILFDSLGQELVESTYYDSLSNPISTRYEYIEWTPAYTGTYYLAMEGNSGYYELLLEQIDESVALGKKVSLLKKADEKKLTREKINAFLLELVEEK